METAPARLLAYRESTDGNSMKSPGTLVQTSVIAPGAFYPRVVETLLTALSLEVHGTEQG